MNLDDKTTNALSAADLAGQTSESVPTKSTKRRKSNGGNGASSRKAKKAVAETEEFADNSASLTLAPANGGAKQRKKMLFEPGEAGAPPSIALMGGNGHGSVDPSIFSAAEAATKRQPGPAPKIVMPAVMESVSPDEVVEIALSDDPTNLTSEVPDVGPAAASEPAAPIADMKGSVFQVATLVMRSSETPQAAAAPSVAPLPEIESPVDDGEEIAFPPAETVQSAPAPVEPKVEEADAPFPPASTAVEPAETAQTEQASSPATAAEPPALVEETRPSQPVPVAAAPIPQPEAPVPDKAPAAMSRFEAIAARAARMSAQSSARPAVQPHRPAPAARAPEPSRAPELPVQAGDIYGYWSRVKNGRRFPSRSDFDAEQLAEHWPNSMLLTCAKSSGNTPVTFSSVLRLGANRRSRPGEDLNFTSMITEWILSTGGEAARAGKPVQDTEVFPTPDGTHAYKIVALPLSDHQTHVDHVLCHLSRS